jgi:hypothetical protein
MCGFFFDAKSSLKIRSFSQKQRYALQNIILEDFEFFAQQNNFKSPFCTGWASEESIGLTLKFEI